MSSKVGNIIEYMESIAPEMLKEDFDNVGLMVGSIDKDVNRVLLALDCTKDVLNEAINKECDMIITHHPLIFRKPSRIVSEDLIGNKIISLIKNDISLYSSHTNLDSAKNGINKTIVEMIGFSSNEIIEKSNVCNESGLGRIVRLDNEVELDKLIKKVKKALKIDNLRVVRGNEKVSTIAIINGSGQDFISDAVKLGADCIITGDTTYHFASDYKEMGISIIDAGHFNTEWLVFLNVLKGLEDKFKGVQFIKSENSEDPYTFI